MPRPAHSYKCETKIERSFRHGNIWVRMYMHMYARGRRLVGADCGAELRGLHSGGDKVPHLEPHHAIVSLTLHSTRPAVHVVAVHIAPRAGVSAGLLGHKARCRARAVLRVEGPRVSVNSVLPPIHVLLRLRMLGLDGLECVRLGLCHAGVLLETPVGGSVLSAQLLHKLGNGVLFEKDREREAACQA